MRQAQVWLDEVEQEAVQKQAEREVDEAADKKPKIEKDVKLQLAVYKQRTLESTYEANTEEDLDKSGAQCDTKFREDGRLCMRRVHVFGRVCVQGVGAAGGVTVHVC